MANLQLQSVLVESTEAPPYTGLPALEQTSCCTSPRFLDLGLMPVFFFIPHPPPAVFGFLAYMVISVCATSTEGHGPVGNPSGKGFVSKDRRSRSIVPGSLKAPPSVFNSRAGIEPVLLGDFGWLEQDSEAQPCCPRPRGRPGATPVACRCSWWACCPPGTCWTDPTTPAFPIMFWVLATSVCATRPSAGTC